MQLTDGARCLLIGANGTSHLFKKTSSQHCAHLIIDTIVGAGKSTILKILGGRHLTKPDGAVLVLGRSAFHDTRLNFERSYLDTDWY
jgi:ABC-type uncharacterized transport system ATPase subunit